MKAIAFRVGALPLALLALAGCEPAATPDSAPAAGERPEAALVKGCVSDINGTRLRFVLSGQQKVLCGCVADELKAAGRSGAYLATDFTALGDLIATFNRSDSDPAPDPMVYMAERAKAHEIPVGNYRVSFEKAYSAFNSCMRGGGKD